MEGIWSIGLGSLHQPLEFIIRLHKPPRGRLYFPTPFARVMQLVTSGCSTVNINGEVGPYFQTEQGVRQGDPFSPLLFNIVVDVLTMMLIKATAHELIRGLCSDLIPGGVVCLQYVDDTIILWIVTLR